jgi:hypothetical protein
VIRPLDYDLKYRFGPKMLKYDRKKLYISIFLQLVFVMNSPLAHIYKPNIPFYLRVIEKYNMYDEYFPAFTNLLEQIMKYLEISRLDQIVPSIRALKILATPTLS